MNNQIKQQLDKETFVNFLKSEITNWNGCYDMYTSVRVDTLQWVIDRIENNNAQVGLIDTTSNHKVDSKEGRNNCNFCDIASGKLRQEKEDSNKTYIPASYVCPVCGKETKGLVEWKW